MTDPAEALRYILKKKIPGIETSSQRLPASSTKLPTEALEIVPLVNKPRFRKLENDSSTKFNVAEKTEVAQSTREPTTSEQTYLVNKNKSLKKFRPVLARPSQMKTVLNEDSALDLSMKTCASIESPGKVKTILSQSSDSGWEFLNIRC